MRPIRMLVNIVAGVSVWVAAATACGQCLDADINGDGAVDGGDLAIVLGGWGTAGPAGDLDGDGTIGAADLSLLLGGWGMPETEGGTFPRIWINGGPNCPGEPSIQVHQYNDDTYILRQSLCTNFEAPFIYLLFGQDKVLMEDTGASSIPLYNTVKAIIDGWLAAHGKSSIQLVVSHSHAHGDHVFNDGQFVGKPNTTVVGTSLNAVKSFFGIVNWPTQIVEYDLGGRVVSVIPIPGHHSAHVAFYDHATGFLLTGDTLYPGRLYISNWASYTASIQRMVDFTRSKPVCWVMGTHIEMSQTPGDDFPIGSTSHPDEHVLQLTRDHLIELNDACIAMGPTPSYQVHDDFIIFPLVLDQPAEPDGPCCERPRTVFEYRRLRQRAEAAAGR